MTTFGFNRLEVHHSDASKQSVIRVEHKNITEDVKLIIRIIASIFLSLQNNYL